MTDTVRPQPSGVVSDALGTDGYIFLESAELRPQLERLGGLQDWQDFSRSWDRLEPDTYLAATGRARRRRFAVYTAAPGIAPVRQPHQPHFQALDYNHLQGDIDRWFAPIEPLSGESISLYTVLAYGLEQFGHIAPNVTRWHVEAHQFRIEARAGRAGEPTPEGVHRDGVDFVLVLLVARENIAAGTTTVHAVDGAELGSFTLTQPLDAALLDDHRVLHGVTAVTPIDPALPSYRDVLVLTYRRGG